MPSNLNCDGKTVSETGPWIEMVADGFDEAHFHRNTRWSFSANTPMELFLFETMMVCDWKMHCKSLLWMCGIISMAWCKTAVSPLLTHWWYCNLSLNKRSSQQMSTRPIIISQLVVYKWLNCAMMAAYCINTKQANFQNVRYCNMPNFCFSLLSLDQFRRKLNIKPDIL